MNKFPKKALFFEKFRVKNMQDSQKVPPAVYS